MSKKEIIVESLLFALLTFLSLVLLFISFAAMWTGRYWGIFLFLVVIGLYLFTIKLGNRR